MKLTVYKQLTFNNIKKIALLSLVSNSLLACHPSSRQTASPADQSDSVLRYCFLRTEGTSQQDSFFVQLSLTDNTVTGTYDWIPAEKDSRKGILTGRKNGDTLQVVWHFSQEGMQDSIPLTFLLKERLLRQKPYEHADFTITYQPSDCQ